MKRILIISFFLLYQIGVTLAQTGRYEMPVFDEVLCNEGIRFSRAVTQGATTTSNLYLDFYEPKGDTLSRRPLVITAFGGAFMFGSRDFVDMKEYCNRLATYGYAAASIDYRLIPLIDVSSTNIIRAGYMAAQDVSAAVRFFKAHADRYRIDPEAIFLLGESAGSVAMLHTVFMDDDERPVETFIAPNLGGIHSSGLFETIQYSPSVAGVISHWGGVLDLDILDSDETTPVCFIHGTNDHTVPYTEGYSHTTLFSSEMPYMYGSLPISQRMASQGHPDFELHPFEGEIHAFYFTSTYQDLIMPKFDACFDIVKDFLLRHVTNHHGVETNSTVPFSVYPNPATDVLVVDGQFDGDEVFSVYDCFGKCWHTASPDDEGFSVDVSTFPAGLYVLVCKKNDKSFAIKFEKSN